MAYDNLLNIVESDLKASKNSNSFKGGMGSIVGLRIDITSISGTVQVIIQESDDNVNFSDSAITKVYDAVKLNDNFVFIKKKPYHRFRFIVNGTVNIELNQG